MSQPAYAEHVRPASALTADRKGSTHFLPVDEHIRKILPGGGLRRGSVVGIAASSPGSMSLMLTLLVEASRAGSWVAIAGLPTVGYVAADELGLVLARTAIIPDLGRDWPNVLAALVDGFDIVVVSTKERIVPTAAAQMAARARQRGCVIVPYGTAWDGVETTLTAVDSKWYSVGEGAGRRLTIGARGRGSGASERRAEMWCPPPNNRWAKPAELKEEGRPRRPLRAVS